jgi:4-hydroxybenzoyl-CoA thioesterase/acyl-CoA thioester hydrolase
MIPTIETHEQVMFFDTDCGGVVHNIAYLRWIETARTRLADHLGLPLREMSESKRFPVVLRTEIDYRSPAKLSDTVRVRGRLDAIEGIRFWCAFELHRDDDETLLVSSRQALALIQMPEGKPMRLPEAWAEHYPELMVRPRRKKH